MKKRGAEGAVSGETPGEPSRTTKAGRPGELVADARNFLEEAQAELKRVYWPSRKETVAFTWVVLIVVVFVSAYLGLVDYFISMFMRLVF